MRKQLKIILIIFILLIFVSAGGFYYYVSDYYQADNVAVAVMERADVIDSEEDFILLSAETSSQKALIFYPGAKVEYSAYLPIMEKIRDKTGITCILVKMPFNMAIFDINKADEIMARFPEISHWYIGGHSMGGAMASSYAVNNQDKIKGLILLASYIYGDYPNENTLTIYGSLNTSVSEKIDYDQNVVVIEGGNHAQFGNYGKQKGDTQATISREDQQDIAVEAIKEFLTRKYRWFCK